MKIICPPPIIGLSGRYRLQVLNAYDAVVREVATNNLIMQSGIDALLRHPVGNGFALHNLCEKCWVGNGKSAPTLTDAGLENGLYSLVHATWESLVLNNLANSYTIVGTKAFQFDSKPREYLIWEVGTSPAVGTPWFSRATIPNAVVVMPTEKLKVVFELTLEVSTIRQHSKMPFDGADLAFSIKYNAPLPASLDALWKSPMLMTGNPTALTMDIYYPGEYWDSGIPGVGTKYLPPWTVQGTLVDYVAAQVKYSFSTPVGLPPVPISAIGIYRGATMLPMVVEFPTPVRLNDDQYFSFHVVRKLKNR